jgi:hypothetical protein
MVIARAVDGTARTSAGTPLGFSGRRWLGATHASLSRQVGYRELNEPAEESMPIPVLAFPPMPYLGIPSSAGPPGASTDHNPTPL